MRIYIHTDLEGISGIDRGEMVPRESEDYRRSCELLMGDLNAAVDGFLGPGQNLLYADAAGHVGWRATGVLPRRAAGDDGRTPLDGSTAAHDWSGYRYLVVEFQASSPQRFSLALFSGERVQRRTMQPLPMIERFTEPVLPTNIGGRS